MKISEKTRRSRNSVTLALSGAADFQKAITQAIQAASKLTPGVYTARPPRQPRVVADPAVVARSVYVSGLAWETTEAALEAHLKRVGAIQKATLLTRLRAGEVVSKGCGTVEFRNAADVKRAVETLNGTELDGRVISVREDRVFDETAREAPTGERRKRVRKPRGERTERAERAPREPREPTIREPREPRERRPRPPREPLDVSNLVVDPRKVYVTSLAWSTTGDELSNVFSGVGHVLSTEIIARRDGRSTGTAVVEYSTSREASEAIERLNGKAIDGREISARVYYVK